MRFGVAIRTGEEDIVILGIGTDLCDVGRIERALERFGERFAERILVLRARALSPPPQAGGVSRQALCRQGGVLESARHRHPLPRQLARSLG